MVLVPLDRASGLIRIEVPTMLVVPVVEVGVDQPNDVYTVPS